MVAERERDQSTNGVTVEVPSVNDSQAPEARTERVPSSEPSSILDLLPSYSAVEGTRDDTRTMFSHPAHASRTSGAATTSAPESALRTEQREVDVLEQPVPVSPSGIPEIRVDACSDRSLTDSSEKIAEGQRELPTVNGNAEIQSYGARMMASLRNFISKKKPSNQPTRDAFVSVRVLTEIGPIISEHFSQGASRIDDSVPEENGEATRQVPDILGDPTANAVKESCSGATNVPSATVENSKPLGEKAKTSCSADVNINAVSVIVKGESQSLLRPDTGGLSENERGRCAVPNELATASEGAERQKRSESSTGRQTGGGDRNQNVSMEVTIEQLDCDDLFGRILTRPCPTMQQHSRVFAKVCFIGILVLAIAFIVVMILVHRMSKK